MHGKPHGVLEGAAQSKGIWATDGCRVSGPGVAKAWNLLWMEMGCESTLNTKPKGLQTTNLPKKLIYLHPWGNESDGRTTNLGGGKKLIFVHAWGNESALPSVPTKGRTNQKCPRWPRTFACPRCQQRRCRGAGGFRTWQAALA